MVEATDATDARTEADNDDVSPRTRRAREENIAVEAVSEGENAVTVTVSNDDNTATYDVMVGKDYTIPVGCTCQDWMFRRPNDEEYPDDEGCKHMRAVSMELPDGDLYEVVESLVGDGVDEAVIREMVDAPAHRINTAITAAREGAGEAIGRLAE